MGNISGNTQYESNNTVCTDTICKKLKMIFSVLFFALLCILGLLVSSTYSILVNCTALLCLLLFLIVGGRLADPIDRLSAKKFNALFVLLLGSAFAVSIYLAYEMRIHLPGDTDIIFASVADLLRDGKLNEANPRIDAMHYPGLGLYTNNDYFCRYPNNIGLLMLYAGVYAFGGKTGLPASTDAGHLPAIVMTSLAVAVTILLVCLCIKIVFKKNSYELFTLLLCYAFLPFVFSIPNFYTDLWVLPFTAGGVYCYLSNKFSAAPKGWRGFLAGLLLSVGVQMKITAAIGFVVIVLDLLLGTHVHRWKNLALLFLGFFLFLFAFTAWYRYSGIIDLPEAMKSARRGISGFCLGAMIPAAAQKFIRIWPLRLRSRQWKNVRLQFGSASLRITGRTLFLNFWNCSAINFCLPGTTACSRAASICCGRSIQIGRFI